MTENKITIVVVDDHALIREGVIGMLAQREEMQVVGEGACGDDVFDLVEKHRPMVLILDLRMPQHEDRKSEERFDVLGSLERLQTEYPETAVIILSQHSNETFVKAAIKHGVRSYLLKDDNLSLDIRKAIDEILAGGVFFSRDVNILLYDIAPENQSGIKLNDRKLEIINLLVRHPEKQIAELAAELHIAPSTMKGHLADLFETFEVPNRQALMIRVLQLGIIPFHCDVRGRIIFD